MYLINEFISFRDINCKHPGNSLSLSLSLSRLDEWIENYNAVQETWVRISAGTCIYFDDIISSHKSRMSESTIVVK